MSIKSLDRNLLTYTVIYNSLIITIFLVFYLLSSIGQIGFLSILIFPAFWFISGIVLVALILLKLIKIKRKGDGVLLLLSSPIPFIVLLVGWTNLPISITHHNEIKMGEVYAKNIIEYKRVNGKLPKYDDWDALERLNPVKQDPDFVGIKPEYKKIDSANFSLTYVVGFDPPYLTYDTRSQKWEMK